MPMSVVGWSYWSLFLPLLMGVSAGSASNSSYSITLLSEHWAALHTHTSRTNARTHRGSVGFALHLQPQRTDTRRAARCLLVAPAPGPAQAFENVHLHLTQRAPRPLRHCTSSCALICESTVPTPRQQQQRTAGPTGRTGDVRPGRLPLLSSPLRARCALTIPGCGQLCHRAVA